MIGHDNNTEEKKIKVMHTFLMRPFDQGSLKGTSKGIVFPVACQICLIG
jgi:hypothetical protein